MERPSVFCRDSYHTSNESIFSLVPSVNNWFTLKISTLCNWTHLGLSPGQQDFQTEAELSLYSVPFFVLTCKISCSEEKHHNGSRLQLCARMSNTNFMSTSITLHHRSWWLNISSWRWASPGNTQATLRKIGASWDPGSPSSSPLALFPWTHSKLEGDPSQMPLSSFWSSAVLSQLQPRLDISTSGHGFFLIIMAMIIKQLLSTYVPHINLSICVSYNIPTILWSMNFYHPIHFKNKKMIHRG